MWTGLPCHAPSVASTVPVCNVTLAPMTRTPLIVGLSYAVINVTYTELALMSLFLVSYGLL